jgi:cyclophilin family peptidyl-prolyl cis-trans isomerase
VLYCAPNLRLNISVTIDIAGKHVVFGRVVEGKDVVTAIENTPVGASDKPEEDVVITDCGEVAAA